MTSENKTATVKKWENALRWTINTLVLVVVGMVILLGWHRWARWAPPLEASGSSLPTADASLAPESEERPSTQLDLPPYKVAPSLATIHLTRQTQLKTEIPPRPRVDVITYTVQLGDSIFSIADDFGLKPETILWGNYETLEDNPHLLRTGQHLRILPVDGIYYQWQEEDDLRAVAAEFKVDPQTIIEYPGNRFDLTLTTADNPNIQPGTWLIIPGGWRPIKDWGPPAITRANPASAAYYGPGYCGLVYEGAIGVGTFVWPTPSRLISGYTYDAAVHPAIDIAGAEGNAVWTVDNGVVVYAGWSNWGYGNLIVIDHGNGWQSAYAHLSAVAVTCGQSVFQGTRIGAVGNTGNSSGAHLHFELVYNGVKVNPLNYLIP